MNEQPSKSDNEKNRRLRQLQDWATTVISAAKGSPKTDLRLDAISGDAGFRRYFRVVGSEPAMLAVDSPPQTEKNQAFCHIAQLFRQRGIHAPQIYAADYDCGFLLIEDMGDVLYKPLLEQSKQDGQQAHVALYSQAEHCLLKMQTIPSADAGLVAYDAEKLQQEMDLFPEWFVKRLLQQETSTAIAERLRQVNQLLIQSALAQPQVVVHRDFHCRNLLQVQNNSPGVIDFQDAVIGPVTYDLVSLYRDCYIRWPDAQVTQWALDYRKQCLKQHVIPNVSETEFLRWFDWMGLQRHLKVLGIFARLYLRDDKPGYLRDLPLVMHYTLSVAKKYPAFSEFVSWFESDLLPEAQKCDWYYDISNGT